MTRITALAAVLLAPFALSAETDAQLLNGGFERGEVLLAFPFSFGVWGVDQTTFLGPDNGIVPAEGERMARFDATTLGTPAVGNVADVWNLFDLSPWASLIASGHGHLRATSLFNRVADGPCVDTRFGLQLQAHDGGPETYPEEWPDPIGKSPLETIFTDGDPATWELLTASLDIPSATTFGAVVIFAIEDVCDTGVPPFDGHYADDVQLFVDAWIDIGFATGGSAGAPELRGLGELSPGAAGQLRLEQAPPSSPLLVVTTLGQATPLALAGGTLAAFPATFVEPRATNSTGTAVWNYTVPGGIAPGVLVTSQFLVADPSAPFGIAFSNAVEGLTH